MPRKAPQVTREDEELLDRLLAGLAARRLEATTVRTSSGEDFRRHHATVAVHDDGIPRIGHAEINLDQLARELAPLLRAILLADMRQLIEDAKR